MQCQGYTINGNRCSRKAEIGSTFCWQHRKIQEEKQITILNKQIQIRNEIAPEIRSTAINKLGDPIINKIAEYVSIPEDVSSVLTIGLIQKDIAIRKFFNFNKNLRINNRDISILYSLSKLKKITPSNMMEAFFKGVRLMEFYDSYISNLPMEDVANFMLLLYQSKNIDMFIKLSKLFINRVVKYYNIHHIPNLGTYARENDIMPREAKLVLNLIDLELGYMEVRYNDRQSSISYMQSSLLEQKMKQPLDNNDLSDIDTTKILSTAKENEFYKFSKKYKRLYDEYFSVIKELDTYYLTDIMYSESLIRYVDVHPDRTDWVTAFSQLDYTGDANWLQFLYNTLKLPIDHPMVLTYFDWQKRYLYWKEYEVINITNTNRDFFSWLDAILQTYDKEFSTIFKNHILNSVKQNNPQIYQMVNFIFRF